MPNAICGAWCDIAGHKVAEYYMPGMEMLIRDYGNGGTNIGKGEGQRENPATFIFTTGHSNEGDNMGEGNPKNLAKMIVNH